MHLHFVLDEPQYNDLFAPLIREARARRHLVTTGLRAAVRYDADAVIALQDIALRGGPRPRVFITHGLGLAKRGHLTLDVDLLLLPYSGEGIVDDQKDGGRAKVVRGLGSPKIDLLAQRRQAAPALRQRMREIYGFDARPIVGYCPTWRHDGTLHHPQRAHRLREAEAVLERDFNLVTLPHSLEADPSEIEELRFRLSSELSRTDHLVAFDAVVTDTSGIGFELCAIDMPLVLLDNPAEPDYLLARMLETPVPIDYGPVCTLDSVVPALQAILATPASHAERRAYWADMAFGPRDGQAAARCIDAICDFIAANHRRFASTPGQPLRLRDYRRQELRSLRTPTPWEIEGDAAWASFPPKGGSAMFGPYQRLGQGRFALEVDLEVRCEHPLVLSVDTHGGRSVVAEFPVAGRLRASLPFTVPASLAGADFEFRLRKPPAAEGVVLLRAFALLLTGLVPEPPPTLPEPPEPPPEPPPPSEPPPPRYQTLPDPLWEEVAAFLRAHATEAHTVLAPRNFLPTLLFPAQMDIYADCAGPYDWVVVHKGRTTELPAAFLREAAEQGRAVLANAVFVLLRIDRLPDLRDSGHVQALLAQLEALADR
jgi:hypothetical protein